MKSHFNRCKNNEISQNSVKEIFLKVKFNDFRDEDGTNADLLAEAVLEEVPDQLVGFMTETGEKIGERNKSKN